MTDDPCQPLDKITYRHACMKFINMASLLLLLARKYGHMSKAEIEKYSVKMGSINGIDDWWGENVPYNLSPTDIPQQ